MQNHERMNRDSSRPSQPYHFITGATQATLGLQCAATSNNRSRYAETGRVKIIHVRQQAVLRLYRNLHVAVGRAISPISHLYRDTYSMPQVQVDAIDKEFLSGTGLCPFHLKPGRGHFPCESSQHGTIQTFKLVTPA